MYKNMSLITTLKQSGLSENEVKVYLANLELGQATVQELARKSGVKRTTIYTVIEGLKQKGLVAETKKGAKTFFAAENPKTLVQFSLKQHQQLKNILPELESIYNISDVKPKVRFYEGKEGYVSVYENILKDKPKELLVIASYDNFHRHLDPKYEEDWIKRRIERKIKLRWLDFETKTTKAMQKEGKKVLREIRFLPKDFPFTSTMFIYSNKVVIVSGRQKDFMAVVVENSEFYQMFKQLFETLWQKR